MLTENGASATLSYIPLMLFPLTLPPDVLPDNESPSGLTPPSDSPVLPNKCEPPSKRKSRFTDPANRPAISTFHGFANKQITVSVYDAIRRVINAVFCPKN